MTGTPRWRAAAPTTPTEWANSGPMMISAPSASACCAACCAPPEVPPSSLIRSWTFGLENSTSAISAAFFIDSATVPALPAADSGRISPTLTAPVPIAAGCCTGPAGGGVVVEQFGGARAGRQQGQQAAGERASAQPAQAWLRASTHRLRLGLVLGLRGRSHGRFPRQRCEWQCQSTLANRHNDDDRLTKSKG